MKTCPVNEKCNCGTNDDDPEYFKKHGRYSWDTEEDINYIPVRIQLKNGKYVDSKVFEKSTPRKLEILQTCYEIDELLRGYCNILKRLPNVKLMKLIDAYDSKYSKRFPPSKHSLTPQFLRNGFNLYTRTTHTFQELDSSSNKFNAVNKPKDVQFYPNEERHGSDEKLRSFRRHVVLKIENNYRDSHNYIMCLLAHELAHTPPNHICFRHDDHNGDFRIFQSLFLSILKSKGFVRHAIFL